MKIQPARIHYKEYTQLLVTEHTPAEIDAEPDYFLPGTQIITQAPYQDIQIVSTDPAGVWVRQYIVLSAVPLVVVPRGPWERCEVSKKAKVETAVNVRTEREVFVPETSEVVWAGPHAKWRVKGVESKTVFAEHIEDKDIAIAIATGTKPYKIETAEAA